MKSLTSEEYAKCFQVFANRTSEYSQMTKFMVDTVNNLSYDKI